MSSSAIGSELECVFRSVIESVMRSYVGAYSQVRLGVSCLLRVYLGV